VRPVTPGLFLALATGAPHIRFTGDHFYGDGLLG